MMLDYRMADGYFLPYTLVHNQKDIIWILKGWIFKGHQGHQVRSNHVILFKYVLKWHTKMYLEI